MPLFEMFFSAADYYHTLAHELVHWAIANTDLVETILDSEAADYARNELVAEFAAMFLLAEQGFSGLPRPRTVAYVRKWCDKGSLTDAEAMEAAGDAGRVTAWLCHEAPAWRAGETHRRMPPMRGSGGFRERTQRILAMRSLAQKAADMSLRPSRGARFG